MTVTKRGSKRQWRIALAVVSSMVCVAMPAGAGLAAKQTPPTADQQTEKATICHKGKKTLRVSVNAVPAHLRHGDTTGACTGATATTQQQNKAKSKGKAKNKPAKTESEQDS